MKRKKVGNDRTPELENSLDDHYKAMRIFRKLPEGEFTVKSMDEIQSIIDEKKEVVQGQNGGKFGKLIKIIFKGRK